MEGQVNDAEVERKLYAMLISSYCVDSSMPSPERPSPTPAVAHYHGPLIAPVADRNVVFPPLYSRFCADLRNTDSLLQRTVTVSGGPKLQDYTRGPALRADGQ